MTIDGELRNQIRRLYYVEHFTINAICQSLAVHHEAVKRAIKYEQFKKKKDRISKLNPFLPLIEEKLNLHGKMTSTKLLSYLQKEGYDGSLSLLRKRVRQIRPKYKTAYIRMSSLPGEEAQVDWGHFGEIQVGEAMRKLYLFVMVLSYSRAIFARFTLSMKTAVFLECHEQAYRFFGGVARVHLYDNLKSVVIERLGKNVRFNSQMLDFSGYYCFEPRPTSPYSGNEKGNKL